MKRESSLSAHGNKRQDKPTLTKYVGTVTHIEAPGLNVFLSGNEAIARGAIEAGVRVATSYPGSPFVAVPDNLANAAKMYPNMHVEWSANEKVAFEVAFGAAVSGLRALTVMKNVGLNWVVDPLAHCAMNGSPGLVIVSDNDPPCENSGSTADIRYLGMYTYTPVLEPSTMQEVKDFTVAAFELSEQTWLPVLVCLTERQGYSRGPVSFGIIQHRARERDARYDSSSPWTRGDVFPMPPFTEYTSCFNMAVGSEMRYRGEGPKGLKDVIGSLPNEATLNSLVESFPYNELRIHEQARIGIITAGVGYNIAMEALKILGMPKNIGILKLATTWPLPNKLVKKMLSQVEAVLVVEEMAPFIEHQVRSIIAEMDHHPKVFGKLTRDVAFANEVDRNAIGYTLGKLIGREYRPKTTKKRVDIGRQIRQGKAEILTDQFRFCPGCPEQAALSALKSVCDEMGVDITAIYDAGCYGPGVNPPLEYAHGRHISNTSMGASIGNAQGLFHAGIRQKVVAITGDSCFFHADIPQLINAVYNKANILVYVMDNRTTAMTGHQPHPGAFGVTATGKVTKELDIAEIARAIQTDFVAVVDPYDQEKTRAVLKQALNTEGVRVVVARRACAVIALRALR